MTLREAENKLKPYLGTWMEDEMASFLLSYVHESSDMTMNMLNMRKAELEEDLKDLEFRYGGEDHV